METTQDLGPPTTFAGALPVMDCIDVEVYLIIMRTGWDTHKVALKETDACYYLA